MRLIDADAMIADLLTVNPQYQKLIDWCVRVVKAQPTVTQWIPFKTREMDDEEKELYPELMHILVGSLPDDGQSILVSDGIRVWADEFCCDNFMCWLDSGYEVVLDEALAWMPLPKPYEENVNDGNRK